MRQFMNPDFWFVSLMAGGMTLALLRTWGAPWLMSVPAALGAIVLYYCLFKEPKDK